VKPKKKRETIDKAAARTDKRLHLALPIRITYWNEDKKPGLEMACTYDISARGARISSLRFVNQTGEVVAVERGRNKAFCRVVWIGDQNSKLHGQIGLECIEPNRTLWEPELRDMQEVYEPVDKSGQNGKSFVAGNRRRRDRFQIQGKAEIVKSGEGGLKNPQQAELRDLSEIGCLVKTKEVLLPGTDIKLVLKVANYDLALKGKVKHSAVDLGVGIEFAQIRKSDRQTLQFLMQKLKEQKLEEILEVEV
jgi:PilZ domain